MLSRTLILCLIFAFSLKADQNDYRLNNLFELLLETDNEIVINEITSNIWDIWHETNDSKIDADFYQGLEAMHTGDLSMSIVFFSRVIKINPSFAEGWNKRATVYFIMGKFDESLKDIKETLKLEPRHFGAMDGMGLIFIQTQQFDKAIAIYDQVLKIFPKSKSIKEKKEYLLDYILNSA